MSHRKNAKYMGFLEYLYIPAITSSVVFSGYLGSTVVLAFLKFITASKATAEASKNKAIDTDI